MTKPAHLLVVALAERFRREKGKDISRDQSALVKLLEAVNDAVRALQTAESTEIHVQYIASDQVGPLHLRTRLTREDALREANVRDIEQLLE